MKYHFLRAVVMDPTTRKASRTADGEAEREASVRWRMMAAAASSPRSPELSAAATCSKVAGMISPVRLSCSAVARPSRTRRDASDWLVRVSCSISSALVAHW